MKNNELFKLSNERGSVTIIVAVALSVLMAFCAVVIDFGRISLEKQMLQNALDAAVLAGAQELPDSTVAAQEAAITYFKENGFSETDIQQVEFLNSNKKIRITAVQPVEYTFAKMFQDSDDTTVTVSAAAQVSTVFDPFKYALFSGSGMDLLQFMGTNTIVGNVHSNESIKNAAEITGLATAVNNIDVKVHASEGTIEGYSYINMPDFTEVTNLATTISQTTLVDIFGATYTSNTNQYTMSDTQLNNLLAAYPAAIIDGNLVINGSGVNATGAIFTTEDIEFNGSDVNMSSSDSVCFCSINGDITFNGGKGDVTGILYAPNGTITLNGNAGIFYGSIVGDQISCNGGINIIYNGQIGESIPPTEIRLVE